MNAEFLRKMTEKAIDDSIIGIEDNKEYQSVCKKLLERAEAQQHYLELNKISMNIQSKLKRDGFVLFGCSQDEEEDITICWDKIE